MEENHKNIYKNLIKWLLAPAISFFLGYTILSIYLDKNLVLNIGNAPKKKPEIIIPDTEKSEIKSSNTMNLSESVLESLAQTKKNTDKLNTQDIEITVNPNKSIKATQPTSSPGHRKTQAQTKKRRRPLRRKRRNATASQPNKNSSLDSNTQSGNPSKNSNESVEKKVKPSIEI